MKIKDLIELYEEKRRSYGTDVYKHVSELFQEAKEMHHKDWLKHPTTMNDHEQSWRAWKGKT
jgi:type II restriction enzyme